MSGSLFRTAIFGVAIAITPALTTAAVAGRMPQHGALQMPSPELKQQISDSKLHAACRAAILRTLGPVPAVSGDDDVSLRLGFEQTCVMNGGAGW